MMTITKEQIIEAANRIKLNLTDEQAAALANDQAIELNETSEEFANVFSYNRQSNKTESGAKSEPYLKPFPPHLFFCLL